MLIDSGKPGAYWKGPIVRMVKIHIPERSDRAKALATITLRERVVCLPDNLFIVPEAALEVLRSVGVAYQELGRGGMNYAEEALRNSKPAQSTVPLVEQALAAFRRDLPELLGQRAGQWVAYQGDNQIGFAPTKTELYQECLGRGLKRGEFLVRSIEPELEEWVIGPGTG